MMPPHSQLSEAEALRIAAYILSLAEERAPSLPVRGEYTPPAVAPDSSGQAVVVLRAAYTDRGANGAPSASGEKTVVLRAPTVVVASEPKNEIAGTPFARRYASNLRVRRWIVASRRASIGRDSPSSCRGRPSNCFVTPSTGLRG